MLIETVFGVVPCEVDCCASGLFLINIVISTAVTVYIVVYPAEWIIDWMEVGHFPQIYILFHIPTVANYTVSQKKTVVPNFGDNFVKF